MISSYLSEMRGLSERARIYSLSNAGITVRISDFGATVLGCDVPDARGNVADIVLGYADLSSYAGENSACLGASVGPVANRTAGAQCSLAGATYHMPANEHGRNNLHSDLMCGLHKRLWKLDALTQTAYGCAELKLFCDIASGEYGLPGTRHVSVCFALSDTGALRIDYRMTSDTLTYANLTNHSYFNLAGHAAGSIASQLLQIHAHAFVPVDEELIPTDQLLSVEGTPFDFRELRAMRQALVTDDVQIHRARGLDHCFCIDGYACPARTPAAEGAPAAHEGKLRHAAHIEDPASGRVLDISITAPGIQVYTGNWLDIDEGAKDGACYGSYAGVAFEPEFYPDAIHHPLWPQPLCAPDAPFHSVMVYEFSTK